MRKLRDQPKNHEWVIVIALFEWKNDSAEELGTCFKAVYLRGLRAHIYVDPLIKVFQLPEEHNALGAVFFLETRIF